MKKYSVCFLILALLFAVSAPAWAAGERPAPAEIAASASSAPDAPAQAEDSDPAESFETDTSTPVPIDAIIYEPDDNEAAEPYEEPSLADGKPGRGSVDDPVKYWEDNGYPGYVSFAYEAGGEKLDEKNVILWFEIGVVGLDENRENAILDLVSPNCRVTFRDCWVSYNQRAAAADEILALSQKDQNILGVRMSRKSVMVYVGIAEGYEKEYAQELVLKYGAFIVITGAEYDTLDDLEIMAGGGSGAKGAPFWLWPLCALALLGLTALFFVNRTRLIPALQTARGTVVTQGAPVSARETVSAVKNSETAPDDNVFDDILKRLEQKE